jgi:delta-lactam-biosynthetic de-N-acetylase
MKKELGKRVLALTLGTVLLVSSALLGGCKGDGSGNTEGETKTTEEAGTAKEESTRETTSAPTTEHEPADVTPEAVTETETSEEIAEAAPYIHFDADLSAISGLSNEVKSWGPGTIADDRNRPVGATDYQELYGKYNADFIKEDSQKIYLTLDEGYENGYTSVILDVLKEKGVSAVFFVTMPYVKAEPDLIRRMIEEGHVVGGHSVSHPADGMPSLSLEKQLSEMQELHEYVKNEFGYEMYLFRYPAGIFSEQSLALMQAIGYRSVFWSFAYRDWVTDDQPDPGEALEKVMSRLHPGAIYLLHAVSATNAQIMGDFIDQARAAGYEFAHYGME